MKSLHVAEGITIPLDFAARTTAILAQKGAGKTYTGLRITEELLLNGQQVVVLDPTGVWWGLRAPAETRRGRAFEVIVLGGEHADAPLEPTAGAIVANLAVESGRSLVLDMSGFESNSAQDRFATDFLETLYRAKSTARTTLHLMVDEADSFAPQRVIRGQERLLGSMEAIVRRGRWRGLGITMISQRPAVLNKNVLTQADLLIALRIVGIQDHQAMATWATMYGTLEEKTEFLDSLPKLAIGEAWFWSPGWLQTFRRAKVSQRVTFDSSRTPDPSMPAAAPKIAAVDIASLSKEIADSVQRAKANDPRALRARVAELEKQLAKKPEQPTIAPSRIAALSRDFRGIDGALRDVQKQFISIEKNYGDLLEKFRVGGEREIHTSPPCPRCKQGLAFCRCLPVPATPRKPPETTKPAANGSDQPAQSIAKAERAIMTVLAQYHDAGTPDVEKNRLALIAGYAVAGGGFNNSLSSLRTRSWITGSDPITITKFGRSVIGEVAELPTGRELLNYWRGRLPKAEATILEQLGHVQDGTISKETLAELAGYAASGGGFNNALSKLRTLKLVQGSATITLAEDLR